MSVAFILLSSDGTDTIEAWNFYQRGGLKHATYTYHRSSSTKPLQSEGKYALHQYFFGFVRMS